MNKYSLIIHCYNCSQFIEKNILRLLRKLKNIKIIYEIILVDDGSTDETFKTLKKINRNYKQIKIFKNRLKSRDISKIKQIVKLRIENSM